METVDHRLSLWMVDGDESVRVFKQFLQAEQLEPALEFWCACRGLRHSNSTDPQTDRKLIRLIYKTYLRTTQADKPSPGSIVLLKIVSSETKSHISERFHTDRDQQSLDASVFDEAIRETERFLEIKYAEFLQSELYLQFVQQSQQNSEEQQVIEQILPSDQIDEPQLPLDSSQTLEVSTQENPPVNAPQTEPPNWCGPEAAICSEPESCPPSHIVSGHRHLHRHRDRRLVQQMDQLPEAGSLRAGSLVDDSSHNQRLGLTVFSFFFVGQLLHLWALISPDYWQ